MLAPLRSVALLWCCALICGHAAAEPPPQWTQFRTRWPVELPCRHFTEVAASNDGRPLYAEWKSADGRATLAIQPGGTRIPPGLDVTRLTELRALSPVPAGEISLRLTSDQTDAGVEPPGIVWRCERNACKTVVNYTAPPLHEDSFRALSAAKRFIRSDGNDERRRGQTLEQLTRSVLDSARQTLLSVCSSRRCSELGGPLAARLEALRGRVVGTITSSSANLEEGSLHAVMQLAGCSLRLECDRLEDISPGKCDVVIDGCGPSVHLYQDPEEVWLCHGPKEASGCWGQFSDYGPAAWIGGTALRARPLP